MTNAAAVHDPSRDFDFILGHWHIHNRRLVKRLQDSTDWETFEATSHSHLLPGGIGNYDDFTPVNWRPGFVGMSLRIFDPATGHWRIYWADNQTGVLQPPVTGEFSDGVGLFEGLDEFQGQANPGALHLVGYHKPIGPLGAGVLNRQRRHVGSQLDYGTQSKRKLGASPFVNSANGDAPKQKHLFCNNSLRC